MFSVDQVKRIFKVRANSKTVPSIHDPISYILDTNTKTEFNREETLE
jgi:hypothetical protein